MAKAGLKAAWAALAIASLFAIAFLGPSIIAVVSSSNNLPESLILLGYDYNRDLVQLSLTLANKGS